MFKNKHFLLALLIAPILSLIAYFATDLALSEKPHAAKEGQSYKLIAKSNCRYTSGLCALENGEFKVQFRSEKLTSSELQLSMTSQFPLEGVKLSVVDSQDQISQPVDMNSADQAGKNWSITVAKPASSDSWLRVAIQAKGTLYYGETQTAFIKYQTLFSD